MQGRWHSGRIRSAQREHLENGNCFLKIMKNPRGSLRFDYFAVFDGHDVLFFGDDRYQSRTLAVAEESVQKQFKKQIGHRPKSFCKSKNLGGRDCGRHDRQAIFIQERYPFRLDGC